jgi:[ribosomal protein S5]-alanine N-acetyltransferase
VSGVADVKTDQLLLAPVTEADAEQLFVIFSDPAGWWYEPAGQHADLETTIGFCQWIAAVWLTDGLSYWTARDRRSGEIVGLGGVRRHGTGSWNLSYRIAACQQGRGLATELGMAALQAAASIDPSVALIAWVDEHNTASRRVAERLGLTNQGPHVDISDGEVRLAYSDRPLD